MLKTSTEPKQDKFPSLDDRVGHLLRRAYQKASTNLARHLRESGLTVPRYTVLHRLREFGAISQNRLGRLVAMEPGNIHDIIRALKAKNLVITRPDPDDSRRRLVELAPDGVTLIDNLVKIGEQATNETFAPLSQSERRKLNALLVRVVGKAD